MSELEFVVSVPAKARYLKSIRAFVQPILRDYFGGETDMVVLALDESCANILKHQPEGGACGVLRLRSAVESGRMVFEIQDFCCAHEIPKIRPRELEAVRAGGLGTHFVDQIMDSVSYKPDEDHPGRMTLVLEKALPEDAEAPSSPEANP